MLATVLIIAVTLIASVVIGGFVFGIFGSSSNSAQLAVTQESCQATKNDLTCAFTITNTGTASAQIAYAEVNLQGSYIRGICPTAIIESISQQSISCQFNIEFYSITNPIIGNFVMSNGAILIFAVNVT